MFTLFKEGKGFIYLVAIFSFFINRVFAQEKNNSLPNSFKIIGEVRGAKDLMPIVGATVRIKGANNGTITDAHGDFQLLVKPKDTLLVSALGFVGLESPCKKSRHILNLTLLTNHQPLNEVMVIGYGHEKKKNIIGSIATVSGEEISRSPAISFDDALIGRAAGVDVLPSSGVPGSATAITIRGLSTLNPDGNQPLIVIDGIPVYGSGQNLNTSTFNPSTSSFISLGQTSVSDNMSAQNNFENDPLAMLNPNDIESIQILKDAYATSIYGSRGAAGVILITTKKGTKGKPRFNVRYITGITEPVGTYSLLNGTEYNQIYTEYYKELGSGETFNSPYNTNWLNLVTRKAFTQNIDASMSAGGDKAEYYVSGSYTNQPSYIINNGYQRYTGRFNLTYHASSALTVGINTTISYTNNTSLNAQSIYNDAILKAPNLPVFDTGGNYAYGKGSNPYGNMDSNPVADAKENTNSLQSEETLGNVYIQYQPVKWLTFRSEFGTEFDNGNAYTRRVKRPSGFGDDAIESLTQNRKIVINNTLTLLNTFGNNHYLNAMIGQSFERSTESDVSIGGYGFFSDDIRSISAAQNTYILNALTQQWALISYFGRINYEYKNKYLAGVTYRVDGSSKFSRNKRYAGFPSFSLGWRISNEPFLKQYHWINDLKIRGSIGFSGDNSVFSYYGNQGQYIINSNNIQYANVPILTMQQPENPNLKWERTRSIDVGMDGSFVNNRLSVTIDYYERHIKDMILSSAVPLYQGWATQPQNIGDMRNNGLELSIKADIIRNKKFRWSGNFNISGNRNKILKLNFQGEEVGMANDAYKYLKVGEPAGQFFLYDWIGVDPSTGNPLWNDEQGKTSDIPPASRYQEVPDVNVFRKPYGTSLPDFFGGLNNSFNYKNWELDIFGSFSVGGKMYNGSLATLLTYSTPDANNLSKEILNHWIIPGQETAIPRLANNSITLPAGGGGAFSGITDYTTGSTVSRFLEHASYFRLRIIRVTYSFNPERLEQISHRVIHSLQVFIQSGNFVTLTNYKGVDPEVNAFGSSVLESGYDELTMPQNKTYQIGVNLGL